MRKITYTTSALLIIINYYYQHIRGKRKMKQTEGEFGFMAELRAPSLFQLFHKEGNNRPAQVQVASYEKIGHRIPVF